MSGLPDRWQPLLAMLAFPFLAGLAGLFVGPLYELGVGGPAVGADGRWWWELLGDVRRQLALLAELLGLELGVGDFPVGAVLEGAGDLLADGADVQEDLVQGVGKDVDPGLSPVDGDLDLGVVPGLSVGHGCSPCLWWASHPTLSSLSGMGELKSMWVTCLSSTSRL